MLERQRSLGVLHARMRQVEGEFFRAEYSGELILSRATPETFQIIMLEPARTR